MGIIEKRKVSENYAEDSSFFMVVKLEIFYI